MAYLKNKPSGIKSELILKKDLIANLFTINFFENQNKSWGDDEGTDFYDKEILKVVSDYAYLAVINANSARKKIKTIFLKCF